MIIRKYKIAKEKENILNAKEKDKPRFMTILKTYSYKFIKFL